MPPWERFEAADGTDVFFVSEQSPMNHDSAIVVCGDDQTLLNLNDARLFPMQFRGIRAEVGGRIDLFAFQGAGASWYPICYEYPQERKAELSRRKRQAKLSYVVRSLEVLEPAVAFPFAGPPCFLDPTIFRYNAEMEAGIFPDQEQVAAWLLERGIRDVQVLLPGDSWDQDDGRGADASSSCRLETRLHLSSSSSRARSGRLSEPAPGLLVRSLVQLEHDPTFGVTYRQGDSRTQPRILPGVVQALELWVAEVGHVRLRHEVGLGTLHLSKRCGIRADDDLHHAVRRGGSGVRAAREYPDLQGKLHGSGPFRMGRRSGGPLGDRVLQRRGSVRQHRDELRADLLEHGR